MAAQGEGGIVVERVPIPQTLDNALIHASIMEDRPARYIIQDALTEYLVRKGHARK